MKVNDHEIRDAMNKRLSFLHENSGRRARIRQRIADEHSEGSKHKKTAWIALTAITALIVTGVALSVGLNLLGMFSNRDARIGEPVAQTALSAQSVTTAQTGEEEVNAEITSTYYDGSSLTVAYTIENASWWGSFTPTEKQLLSMTKTDTIIPITLDGDPDDPLVRQYLDAVENGTACGLIYYTAEADDITEGGFGIDLSVADETYSEINDGNVSAFRKYAGPLPDREYLYVDIQLWKNATYLYFDGTDAYTMDAQPVLMGAMMATAWREGEANTQETAETAAETRHLTGTGSLLNANYVAVYAEADVSATHGEITMWAHGNGFADPNAEYAEQITDMNARDGIVPELIGDYWYELEVWDADENLLLMGSTYQTDTHTVTASFENNGSLPETLTAYLFILSRAAGTNVTIPITLTPATDPVYVSTWEELNAAAEAGAGNVVITEDITYGEDENTIVFNHAVTIQSEEGQHYVIDGNGRQIFCVQGENQISPLKYETIFRNLTFQGGDTSDKSMDVYDAGYGSAVFVQGPLTVEGCIFQNNMEGCGGTLCVDGDAALSDCTFKDNRSTQGGGLYVLDGNAYISGCTFTGNRAYDDGGSIYAKKSNLTIVDSVISGNTASKNEGGGICMNIGSLTITGCTLSANTSEGIGGAISAYACTVELGSGTVLSENQADAGGAVYINSGDIVLSGGEVLNNTADSGGGICAEYCGVAILAGTIRGNAADIGAGIYAAECEITFADGTITENTASDSGGGLYLINSPITQETDTVSDNVPDNVARPTANPVYVSTWEELNAAAEAGASNVILTTNIHYGEGDSTVVFANAVTIESAEGKQYTLDGQGKQILCVQGADADTPLEDLTTIRNITFQHGGVSDTSTKVFYSGCGMAVSVQGPLLMEGCTFKFNVMMLSGALAVFGDATLTDCLFDNNWGYKAGGLYAEDADVILNGCTFSNNQGGYGSGIYMLHGSLTGSGCLFSDNKAENNGAAILVARCALSLVDSTLQGNIAGENGGAVCSYNESIHLSDTLLTQNEAAIGGAVYINNGGLALEGAEITANAANTGAGIYAVQSDVTLTSGIVTDNTADVAGGGIYLQRSTYTVEAGTISDNSPDDTAQP